MILKYLLVPLMALNAFSQTFPPAVDYLLGIHKLVPSFDQLNLFDGPANVSGAPITTHTNVTMPTREEMMYYNYYTGSVNCPAGAKTMTCSYCSMIKGDITNYVVFDNSTYGTTALVAVSANRREIVVAFRATENLWNVLLDVYFINSSPPGADQIKIHRGFYIAAMSLYERVVKTIGAFQSMKSEYKNYKIVLTGHSLGAAMARVTQFFFSYLKQFPGVAMEVYTYGEPRSGNKGYVDYLNSQNVKTARITNRADLVCHVAPTSILGTTILSDAYHHVLIEYFIDNGQEKFADQSVYEDSSCANSYGPLYSVIDHLSYFDVNHLRCLSDAEEFLAIPVISDAFDYLPPLPTFIPLTDVADLLLLLLGPLLG